MDEADRLGVVEIQILKQLHALEASGEATSRQVVVMVANLNAAVIAMYGKPHMDDAAMRTVRYLIKDRLQGLRELLRDDDDAGETEH